MTWARFVTPEAGIVAPFARSDLYAEILRGINAGRSLTVLR